MSFTRKAINFDLSTADLKKYFKNTAEAYNQIKNFMLQNGFEHRQYSGYVSKEAMEDDDVALIAFNFTRQFRWLSHCTQKFDVTDIGDQHDLMDILTGKKSVKQTRQQVYSKDTLDKQNALKQKVAKFAKVNSEKSQSKDIER